ncbi:MSMEG_4193 family putative phosphomutase [Janibacter sp. CX7]|uniref:MSMEG_4193 family putative phosphomutase n=1 Tax=unclassified Janibacter TaxID=2649294 RepID=UPI0020CE7871|nr:MSMEG_4193 family putative phosphomutase [Janibacter sp. CX7]UTT64711.1 MSMEG_4193 family putative phosphomutase [Janibacter sp. CX7]
MAYCILIRHGRSTANTKGVLAGWTPGVSLDETGRQQAARLVERLEDTPFVHVATSPLQRCRETAEPLLAAHGLEAQVHEGLGECRYGAWTGRAISELAKDPLWRVVQDTPSRVTFPAGDDYDGESMQAMSDRAVAAVREIDAAVTAEHGAHAVWAAVSHGDVIKAVLADAVGTPLDDFQRLHVDPASISVVHYTESRPMLLRSNDTGSSALKPPPPAPDTPAAGDAVVGGGAGLGSTS